MTTMPAPATHRSRALGVWALVCAIVAPVWLFAGFYLAIAAMADTAPPAVVVLANVLVFGWFVVPLAVIGALVLGILAVAMKRGKSLGIAAVILLLLGAIGGVLFVAVSFGVFS